MILGMISLYNFPFAHFAVHNLQQHCDRIIIRCDGKGDNTAQGMAIKEARNPIVFVDGSEWNRWNWREQMLRKADDIKPELILCPDEDEIYGTGIEQDIATLMQSDARSMFFGYAPLPTADGAVMFDGKPYPGAPHMKAFKWEEGLTYTDYQGYARVTNYVDKPSVLGKSKILHYCAYTEKLRAGKDWKW